jgi:dCMP deaminase
MRPSLHETMIELAFVWAKRGSCAKRKVGCVIVNKLGHVISSGYNGQPRGMVHCTEENPCPAFDNADLSCVAIHAEINALIRCPDIEKAYAIYITTPPCDKCRLALQNTAIEKIYYYDENRGYCMDIIGR